MKAILLTVMLGCCGWVIASEDYPIVGYIDTWETPVQDQTVFPLVSCYGQSWMQDLPQEGRTPQWGAPAGPCAPQWIEPEEENLK